MRNRKTVSGRNLRPLSIPYVWLTRVAQIPFHKLSAPVCR